MRRTALSLAVLLVLGLLVAPPTAASEGGENITPVANLEFPTDNAQGTDSYFIEMDLDTEVGQTDIRTIGVFGSIRGGAKILDVTDGGYGELGYYDCLIGQGDVQIFQRGERDEAGEIIDLDTARTYFTFTDDGYSGRGGICQQEGDDNDWFADAGTHQGTFIVDITDPTAPSTVSFVPFPKGSHNMTVHPSTNFLYNSNSELITNAANAGIEVWEITDLTAPVNHGTLDLPIRPGLGTDSHDITFNADGSRAYSAALSQTVIINTENPAEPVIVSSFIDPAINVEHQANPVTLSDPILGERDFLIVEDEFAGAAGAEQVCPSGGTHVYDITGELELAPVKVGSWYIDDVTNTNSLGNTTSCTAHVFDIHEDAAIMTMSFYGGGVRVIDLSNLVGVSLGSTGMGMREIGYHRFENSNSWSVKAAEVDVAEDGTISATLYSNDINRGIDVYQFEGQRPASILPAGDGDGRWFAGTSWLDLNGPVSIPAGYEPFCLLGAATDLVSDVSLTLALPFRASAIF